jgi:hypothetical protein
MIFVYFFLKKIKQDFLNLTGANFIYPFYPNIKKDNGIFKGEKKNYCLDYLFKS